MGKNDSRNTENEMRMDDGARRDTNVSNFQALVP